jgi:hypothetical protein
MSPPVVDHTVTILVLDAQLCYNDASITQNKGGRMYCIQKSVVIANFSDRSNKPFCLFTSYAENHINNV